jgi:uroporphyrin-III C-methyltransferase
VFGRAGEEIDAARAAGLRVEVVPGVTAGLGAAAGLGLSLTDRRAAQGVAFVTGHARPGGREPDWHALARSGLTLVVYMGTQRAAAIARALLEGGLPAATPAVIVRNATLDDTRHHATTLEGLLAGHDGLAREGERPAPGVLLIGEVTRAAAALAGRYTKSASCSPESDGPQPGVDATMAACHAA